MNRLTSLLGCLAAVLCCAALLSCSDVEPLELSNATLEGKVTYKGKPVPYALVIVENGQQSGTSRVATDGTYRVEHAPTGEVQVAVNTDAGRGMMMGEARAGQHGDGTKPTATFVGLPKKFHDPSTSGITTTVTEEGTSQFDIEIE